MNKNKQVFKPFELHLKSAKQIKKIPKTAVLMYSNDNDMAYYFTRNCAYWVTADIITRLSHKDFACLVMYLAKVFRDLDSFKTTKGRGYVV